MRRLPLLALGLALLAPPAAVADISDWKGLPYFHFDEYELYAATDARWIGALKEVRPDSYRGTDWSDGRGVARKAIWAKRCTKKKQVVRFTKVVDAPGQASAGEGALDFASGTHSITKVEVRLNGILIHTVRRGGEGEFVLDPADLRAFRFGHNTFEVRATKKKGPKCNAGRSSQLTGVAVGVTATFRANLRIRRGPDKEYARVSAGQSHSFITDIGSFSDGPATSLNGALAVKVTGDSGFDIVALLADGRAAPYGTCSVTKVDPKLYEILCPFELWAPSLAAGEVRVQVGIQMNPNLSQNFDEATLRLSWSVLGGDVSFRFGEPFTTSKADPNRLTGLSDDRSQLDWVLCSENYSDPGCAGAE